MLWGWVTGTRASESKVEMGFVLRCRVSVETSVHRSTRRLIIAFFFFFFLNGSLIFSLQCLWRSRGVAHKFLWCIFYICFFQFCIADQCENPIWIKLSSVMPVHIHREGSAIGWTAVKTVDMILNGGWCFHHTTHSHWHVIWSPRPGLSSPALSYFIQHQGGIDK